MYLSHAQQKHVEGGKILLLFWVCDCFVKEASTFGQSKLQIALPVPEIITKIVFKSPDGLYSSQPCISWNIDILHSSDFFLCSCNSIIDANVKNRHSYKLESWFLDQVQILRSRSKYSLKLRYRCTTKGKLQHDSLHLAKKCLGACLGKYLYCSVNEIGSIKRKKRRNCSSVEKECSVLAASQQFIAFWETLQQKSMKY